LTPATSKMDQSFNQFPDYPIIRLPDSRAVIRVLVALAFLTAGATSTALAGGQKWELEFVGGGAFPISGGEGATALPLENSTLSGGPPGLVAARIVSSWYFGDGASQLNQAIASQFVLFRVTPSIVPLDSVLQSRFAKRRPGPTLGLRVSRVLTPRFSAEFTLESVSDELAIESNSFTGLEASRLSFVNVWNGFFPGPVSPEQTVSSVATIEDNRGRQLATTGALLINLAQGRRLTPYAAVGAGVVVSGDENPAAQLVGRYQYTLPALPAPIPVPTLVIDETDTVSIRTAFDNRFAFVIGGGVKYSMNARFSLRLDVRDVMYGDSQRTELDATPSTVANSNSALITGTVPRLAFGSSPFVRSTLSGGAISSFETFTATGTIHQIHATGGLIWRF